MIRKGAPKSHGGRPGSSGGGCGFVRALTCGLLVISAGWLALGVSMFRAASQQADASVVSRLKVTEEAMARKLRGAEEAALRGLRGAEAKVSSAFTHRPPGYSPAVPLHDAARGLGAAMLDGDDQSLKHHAEHGAHHEFSAAAAAASQATPAPEKDGSAVAPAVPDATSDGGDGAVKASVPLVIASSAAIAGHAPGGVGFGVAPGNVGWDQSQYEAVWSHGEAKLPPFWTPPEGVDLDDTGSMVDGQPTIFLMVASYRGSTGRGWGQLKPRDVPRVCLFSRTWYVGRTTACTTVAVFASPLPVVSIIWRAPLHPPFLFLADFQCRDTVSSALERATHPSRVVVAVVEQNDFGGAGGEGADQRCTEPHRPCAEDPSQPLCARAHQVIVPSMHLCAGLFFTS
jgi:hypothetical protein